jgi:hypothetical protein
MGGVMVTTQSGCAWTASGGSWMNIIYGASGTGSSMVMFTIPANNGSQRTLATTIAGRALTVTQQ